MNGNLKAFSKVIRHCEGTADAKGYARLFGGANFASFNDHPRIYFQHGGSRTSAAGAYMVTATTFDWVKSIIKIEDFTPPNQDKIYIYLLKYRKAYDHVVLGNIQKAIELLRKEWTSLPGAGQNQNHNSLTAVLNIYKQNGGQLT